MIRLRFRCTDHGTGWQAFYADKATMFRDLADASDELAEAGVAPCKGYELRIDEVVLDDLSAAERQAIADEMKADEGDRG